MRKRTRLAIVGASLTLLAGAASTLVLPGAAFAAGPSVTIPAGPFVSGFSFSISGSKFPPRSTDPTGLEIIECSDPGGLPANLPTDVSGCEGATSKNVFQDNTGSFSNTYTPVLLNSGNSSITCDATNYCALWVGVDFNTNFGDAASTAFSSAFLINPAVAPTITSANHTTFTEGNAGTFTVTSTGTPANAALSESGALPSGVTFTDNGNGTATLAGTPAAATGGTYPITITANNGVSPNGTQNFTLTVDQAPAITSANNTTFTVGNAGTFSVTTSGFPTNPALGESGALPSGVTFTDNGNGTATLAGTPGAGTGGSYPITITANNGVSPNGAQNFTLTVDQAPAITSANNKAFPKTTTTTFTVTTTGNPKPSITITSGTLPSGVTFHDNGNGTGTLSGKPTVTGIFPLQFTAANGTLPNAVQAFNLYAGFVITTASLPDATRGHAYSATLQTANGVPAIAWKITLGALPGGLTLSATTGKISGTPKTSDAVKTYKFTVQATDHSSPTHQVAKKNLQIILH